MKKLFALILALAMVLSLAACGGKEEKPAEAPSAPAETPAEKPAESDLTEWEQFANIYATDETDEEL